MKPAAQDSSALAWRLLDLSVVHVPHEVAPAPFAEDRAPKNGSCSAATRCHHAKQHGRCEEEMFHNILLIAADLGGSSSSSGHAITGPPDAV
jgi:hypothetical protein